MGEQLPHRVLRALAESQRVSLRSRDERELLEGMCRIVVDVAGYAMAWVGYAEPDEAKTVRPVARAGAEEGYLDSIQISYGDNEHGRGPTGTAIRTGQLQVFRVLEAEPAYSPWRDAALRRGYRSSAALPLMNGEHAFGAMSVYSFETDAFDEDERTLLGALAVDLAFGIISKRAETTIAASRDRLARIIDRMSLHVAVVSPDGRILEINHAALACIGRQREDIIGAPFSQHFGNAEAIERARRGESVRRQDRIASRDIDLRLEPLHDESGRVAEIVVTGSDITDHLAAEAKLRQAEKLEIVGQLAGGVAHDFNNLLTVILASSEVLHARITDPTMRALAADVRAAAQRASDLTSRLLLFARRGAGSRRLIDLHAILDEVVALVSRTVDRRIATEVHHNATSPVVSGDATWLQSAILNLAINARDAMPTGGRIVFSTRDVTLDEAAVAEWPDPLVPGTYVEVSVSDTGGGIAPDVRPHIFEPFFTTKGPSEGTGLGLAGVRSCARAHDGSVMFESEVGLGANFRMVLPRAGALAEGVASTTTVAARGGTILVVDDDASVRRALLTVLDELGYSPRECADPGQALSSLAGIDVVLLDINMPGHNGIDVLRAIRRVAPALPVILCSGYAAQGLPSDVLADPRTSFCAKPVQIDRLAAALAAARSLGR